MFLKQSMVLNVEAYKMCEKVMLFRRTPEFTLPEANNSHLKMDGWKRIVSFWDGGTWQVICEV